MKYIFIILAILTSVTIYPADDGDAETNTAARFSPDWRKDMPVKLFDGKGNKITEDEFIELQSRSAANTPVKQLLTLEELCKNSPPFPDLGFPEFKIVVEHGSVRFE